MLKIRLQRIGKIHNAVYRIVVAENTAPVKGKFIERLGSFAAQRKEATLQINTERAGYWISVGAIPSDSVARLLVKNGLKSAEKFIQKRVMKMSNAEKAKLEAEQKAKEEAEAKKAEEEAAKTAESKNAEESE
ncbi:30S ribosomal protein S16 [Candidatus Gracilibacteria bacterium]|nr:30S ribosomal protein S16 [Candidatus Gracilibacteria bacterium]